MQLGGIALAHHAQSPGTGGKFANSIQHFSPSCTGRYICIMVLFA